MTQAIVNNFVQLYDAEVKAAYQREGSLLRQTLRIREGVVGERVYFPRIGKGMATSKARNADVVPMNIGMDKVFAQMSDKYAAELLDELDLAKVNWSVRTETARAAAWAIGRAVDDNILTTVTASTNTTSAATINGGGNTKLTLAVVASLSKSLNARDVQQDRMRYLIVSPDSLEELLSVEQATNLFYVREQLLITGEKPTFWMGFNVIVHSGLPTTLKAVCYHKQSVGLGFNSDIKSRVDWVPLKAAWLINSYASFGSVIIDESGVQLLTA